MRPLLSRSSIVTIAVVVMAACAGEAASPDDPLGLADLLGPWRREPIAALDPGVVAALDGVCRAFPDFPPGQELVLVDARGRGRLQAQYAGPNSTAECTNDLVIHPDGSVTGAPVERRRWWGSSATRGTHCRQKQFRDRDEQRRTQPVHGDRRSGRP